MVGHLVAGLQASEEGLGSSASRPSPSVAPIGLAVLLCGELRWSPAVASLIRLLRSPSAQNSYSTDGCQFLCKFLT